MDFGQVKKVELREIWKHEAIDFTPWLADNLEKLGERIGLELELITREASVGSFYLDILAKDVGRNRIVIIENQLEPTDHKHLGQLITYASFYKAEVIVWVSQFVQEEHRAAVDWLNNNTQEKLEFFAIEVEVIQIDDSKPALQFKLKAFPNEWQKSTHNSADNSQNYTVTQAAYREFFQKLIDDLRNKHQFTNAKIGQPQSWYSFSSGRTGIIYGSSFAKGNKVRVDMYIDTGSAEKNKRIFATLQADKDIFEKKFMDKLEWEELPNRRASRIAIYRDGSINDDTQSLEEIKNWMIDKLLRMKKTFSDKLSRLDLED